MTTRTEFIEREILPTLGEYVNDYDLDAICDEVSAYDPREGYIWKDEYASDEAAYWQVVSKHDNAE